jgi:hypothetical protein
MKSKQKMMTLKPCTKQWCSVMGISKTQEALARIQQVDPTSHAVLSSCVAAAFGGTLTVSGFQEILDEAGVLKSEDTDVDFVIESIVMIIMTG